MRVEVSILDTSHPYWEAIVYASKEDAYKDQSILGSNWEIPDDMLEAYAHIGPFRGINHMFNSLRKAGYRPTEI